MPYSDEEMREIAKDPVRLKCYYWKVAMNARRLALRNQDLPFEADVLIRFSDSILENIDAFVEYSLEV